MNAKINISRKVLGQVEDKGELSFIKGDYFNIYAGLGSSEELGNNENSPVKNFLAFQVGNVNSDSVDIEVLYPTVPPTEPFTLKVEESKEIDFNEYGIYTLTLKSIQS